ncbi:glycerol-3-phosphate acyltransferase [Vallitalea okinawensis]|uniref:glycerol-3-phosphate acyltransferase n=1 Tax=Vallitalea okinawensis TaxID=2078660 RepID=UPI00130088CA|nr:glycerol-3-phosphate acyltransferase [Vallitalea okinawensis]
MNYFIASFVGYLFGCFQSSYFIGKFIKKIDIRDLGNGNAGASNTTVAFGAKYGLIVAVLDILKAVVSIAIMRLIFKNSVPEIELYNILFLNGLFVIIGHNFPFFMSFKGGKGTASLLGMLLAIDFRLGLLGILVMVVIPLVTDYIVLGTMGLIILLIGGTLLIHNHVVSLLIVTFIAAMSVYKHIPNLKRIINGSEKRVRSSLSKKDD